VLVQKTPIASGDRLAVLAILVPSPQKVQAISADCGAAGLLLGSFGMARTHRELESVQKGYITAGLINYLDGNSKK